jgi:hypothetical protein
MHPCFYLDKLPFAAIETIGFNSKRTTRYFLLVILYKFSSSCVLSLGFRPAGIPDHKPRAARQQPSVSFLTRSSDRQLEAREPAMANGDAAVEVGGNGEQEAAARQASTFAELGICAELVEACDAMGWKEPTRIQAEAIPHALQGTAIPLGVVRGTRRAVRPVAGACGCGLLIRRPPWFSQGRT